MIWAGVSKVSSWSSQGGVPAGATAGADARAALAARLPSFVLTANAVGAAIQFADMFATGNPFWALLGGVTAPVFHAGGLLHQHHAAQAALDAAKSQYRAAVLQAF